MMGWKTYVLILLVGYFAGMIQYDTMKNIFKPLSDTLYGHSKSAPLSNIEYDYEKLDFETSWNELNLAEETKTKVNNYVKIYGTKGLKDYLSEQLGEYKNSKVNIAVTGESGAGKSTLINTMRNLRPKEKGSAEVRSKETTKEPTPYEFPNLQNIVMWDLPGVDGSLKFSKERYIESVKLASYDALLIVCSIRFKQNDIWIAKKAKENMIPFYLIRTKINIDVDNDREENPDHNESKLLDDLRLDLENQLKQNGLDSSRIFLVSGKLRHSTAWDFPELMKNLTKDTPGKKSKALAVAIASSSTDIIQMKKDHCASRIDEVAVQVVASDDITTALGEEIKFYQNIFGVSPDDQKRWKNKFEHLNDKYQEIIILLSGVTDKLEKEKRAKDREEERDPSFSVDRTIVGIIAGATGGVITAVFGGITGLAADVYSYYSEKNEIVRPKERITKRIEELTELKAIKGGQQKNLRLNIVKEARVTLREILDHVANLSNEVLNQSIDYEKNRAI